MSSTEEESLSDWELDPRAPPPSPASETWRDGVSYWRIKSYEQEIIALQAELTLERSRTIPNLRLIIWVLMTFIFYMFMIAIYIS